MALYKASAWPASLGLKKSRNGKGIFAKKSFKEGDFLLRLAGKIMRWDMLKKKGGATVDNAFRYGPETYLSPQGNLGDFLNHSCNPNSGVKKIRNTLYVTAIRNIRKGEEITADYSTLIGSDDIWRMKCNCGQKNCRKKVREFSSLPDSLRQKYVNLGIVGKYISG